MQLPKAELHVHLEGCMTPALLVELAQKHSEKLDPRTVKERYNTTTFLEFLELFKWATSYLREPDDYERLAELTALR
ncbi:MAG: adenosine deaminase, partial [Candidatus Acidiferrales bacterium]